MNCSIDISFPFSKTATEKNPFASKYGKNAILKGMNLSEGGTTIDRNKQVGFCGVGELPRVAKAYLHKWEEPCISGTKGSGTVFFSGCSLKCIYCQNFSISNENMGYDVTKEPIPVVPSQHYFMGGIDVDGFSKTSMDRLYAIGETACNGVHGRNRLASNSLLESLVFAKRAASHINLSYDTVKNVTEVDIDIKQYKNYQEEYKQLILESIDKERNSHE